MVVTNLGLVGDVMPGSQADLLGIRIGSQLLTVAGEVVNLVDT